MTKGNTKPSGARSKIQEMRAKMKKSKQENDVENQVNVGDLLETTILFVNFFLGGGGTMLPRHR